MRRCQIVVKPRPQLSAEKQRKGGKIINGDKLTSSTLRPHSYTNAVL